jgi:hypothetical protein
MLNILSLISGKKKQTGSGWTTFNAPCCHHRGHKADRRMRAGVIFTGPNLTYHCFNCGYKTGYTLGKSISGSMRSLLMWLGADDEQIQRWSLESLQNKDLLDFSADRPQFVLKLDTVPLPEGSLISPTHPLHPRYIDYLTSRCIKYDEYPFMVTPMETGRQRDRIILPFTHEGRIVGSTSRYLDDKLPKYINDQQTGYVFGMDFQQPDWEVCLLFEGVFDAISMKGCAYLHNTINQEQSMFLATLNKPIIVVPDQDLTGLMVCERALELGYKVSLPNWEPGVKDANDAMIKYGRVATLLSILRSATMSKIKIEMRRNSIVKALRAKAN